MNKQKILLVEDEEVLAMVIKETLERFNFDVVVSFNGVEGWTRFIYEKPDCCIIDIMLPRKDGISLVSDIRKVNLHVPIILLTSRVRTEDVLKGLTAGADDYIKKPFSLEELILRVKGLLRRSDIHTAAETLSLAEDMTIGRYSLKYSRQELTCAGKIYNLSEKEADLLKLLMEYKNNLLDRHTALIKIWGDDNIFNSRSMDVYVTRIRKYLADDATVQIINIRSKGYKLIG
jgi:two-component system, OmpR family, response regulator TrcR